MIEIGCYRIRCGGVARVFHVEHGVAFGIYREYESNPWHVEEWNAINGLYWSEKGSNRFDLIERIGSLLTK